MLRVSVRKAPTKSGPIRPVLHVLLRDFARAYATSAARPYCERVFGQRLREWRKSQSSSQSALPLLPQHVQDYAASAAFWEARRQPKPRVLMLAGDAPSIRVR